MKVLRNNVRVSSGFTLIEVVIALAVFAVVGTLAFSGLNAILKWQANLNNQTNQLQAVQLTLKYLERDINQIMSRTTRDQFGDSQPALLSDGENELNFTYSGWRNPTGLSRSNIQRILYRIDDNNNLVRNSWNRLDGAIIEDAREVILIKEIENIQWEFIDTNSNDQDQWPPLTAEANTTLMPRAIAVNLNVSPFGEINRIFTLPQ
ncbi:MAG: type II secretion system minor pseudopilin GspJ [Pseudomonadota bacterium]